MPWPCTIEPGIMKLLLLYPPLAKNCEPPPGIGRLAGFLRANRVQCTSLDCNRTALHYLLGLGSGQSDTWSRRADKHLADNIAALQQPKQPEYLKHLDLYGNLDRYKRAVNDINRVLSGVGRRYGASLSLSNYQDQFSPLQSDDLLATAESCQNNLFYPHFRDSLFPLIGEEQPEYIGISLTYLSQAVPSFVLIGAIRAEFPGIKIILGGGLVTSWMRGHSWSNPFSELVDHCIAGPGEQPLLELLTGSGEQGRAAAPQYDCTEYLAPGFILPYAASSGCYWNKCLFCPETAEENPYRPVPTEQVLSDIQTLLQRHPTRLIHFLDNAISPALMRGLIANPPGVPWYGFARVSQQLADVNFCRELRKSGCVMLKLGLESGDQEVLDRMEKGIALNMVAKVLQALQAADIHTYIYLLFGTPAEDREAAIRTLEFTARHHGEITFLNLAIFNLPLGGPESAGLVTKEFYQGDLSLYADFVHPRGWSRQKVRQFLDREFKTHPAIAPILRRDPPFFTSNHAPLFHPACK